MSEHEDWAWLPSTKALQERAFGYVFPLKDDALADYVTWNHTAAVLELGELLNEVGWKPWAQPRGWVNQAKAITELVDVLHFVANIAVALGVDEAELWAAYRAKQRVNAERQARGYDGVTEKCPVCRRATDDGPEVDGPSYLPYCGAGCAAAAVHEYGVD